jgi:hypothetical protein
MRNNNRQIIADMSSILSRAAPYAHFIQAENPVFKSASLLLKTE